MTIQNTRIASGLGSLASLAVVLSGCLGTSAPQDIGGATVRHEATEAASPAVHRPSNLAEATDGPCSSAYTHAWTSVDIVITNNNPR